eukprot:1001622-Pelagomonas_calceolata.AAC.2
MQNGTSVMKASKSICMGLHSYWVEESPGNAFECRTAFCCPDAALPSDGKRWWLQMNAQTMHMQGMSTCMMHSTRTGHGTPAAFCITHTQGMSTCCILHSA